jgi:hypothetical protein
MPLPFDVCTPTLRFGYISFYKPCLALVLQEMLYSILPTGISDALNSSAQELFFTVLKSIAVGRLEVELRYPSSTCRVICFGDPAPNAEPVGQLIVKDPSIWWQLCANMDVVRP